MDNAVVLKDDIYDELVCPFCKDVNAVQYVIRDYTGLHDRETLIHCDGCEGIFIIHYKFDYIEKLVRTKKGGIK